MLRIQRNTMLWKDKKLICDKILLAKGQILFKFHKILCWFPLFVFIPYSRLHIVFNCIEQLQLHATNSGKYFFHFDINFSFKCFLLCNHPLCLFSLLTLLRLSMAKSKISLGKCHIAFENMWVNFKLTLISNIIPQWWENRLSMISIALDHEIFAP